MFLLILRLRRIFSLLPTFTFHYVSTYTVAVLVRPALILNLHSTMFLLIRFAFDVEVELEEHLHSTMFLLILGHVLSISHPFVIYIPLCFYLYNGLIRKRLISYLFTFHYVSTYTSSRTLPRSAPDQIYIPLCFYLYRLRRIRQLRAGHLHSTMFLLILVKAAGGDPRKRIYIPLCFYLYPTPDGLLFRSQQIYIPLCFYLYETR